MSQPQSQVQQSEHGFSQKPPSQPNYSGSHRQSEDKNQYLDQLENLSKKERFGLFSQPPSLALGDKYQRAKSEKPPKNILINPQIRAAVEPSLFQFPNFITLNDPYKESFKAKQIVDKERVRNIPHTGPFKPTDTIKTKVGSEYEHMKEFNDKQYNKRSDDGQIILEPRNFYTNPQKKGFGNTTVGHLFEPVCYQTDPYNAKKESDIQERATHQSKILFQNKPYCSTTKNNQPFNQSRDIFGLDRPMTEGKRRNYNYKPADHLGPFKPGDPSKQGFNKTIGKFPEYIEEGEKPKRRKDLRSQTGNAWRQRGIFCSGNYKSYKNIGIMLIECKKENQLKTISIQQT